MSIFIPIQDANSFFGNISDIYKYNSEIKG